MLSIIFPLEKDRTPSVGSWTVSNSREIIDSDLIVSSLVLTNASLCGTSEGSFDELKMISFNY